MLRNRKSLLGPAAAVAAVLLAATSCAESQRDDDGDAADRNETEPFVFATAGDVRSLDPILASDGETFRVTHQVVETLLRHEPGGTEIVGALAEDWDHSEDGTEWTFHLRDDVRFHDDEPFNAEAVCANFDRWFNFTDNYQNSAVTYYWTNLFGGFAENESDDAPDPNYVGCTAEEDLTAVLEFERFSPDFPGAFTMEATGIVSPASIEEIGEPEIAGEGGEFTYPEYTQEPGTIAGTGPYEYAAWDHSERQITLERFDDYWGEPANIATMIFRTIDDEGARRQALEAGDIHGYDLVAPADVQPLEDAGFQAPVRDVFNILYLAFVQDNPNFPEREEAAEALAEPEVRQAIAHAVNRQRIVDTILPEGGEVATQFMPDTLDGWSPDVETYDYDPELAREMLEDAGYDDLTLDFCYPTEVTRPYMPAPRDIFEVIVSDLEEVGITVEPDSLEWTEYIPYTEDGGCSLYLLGWTGDFNEAYNFIGTWFADYREAWGHRDDDIFDALDAVAAEPDPDARVALYQEANDAIMESLPGLPISSSPPSLAFAPDIDPPTPSPLTREWFAETSFQ